MTSWQQQLGNDLPALLIGAGMWLRASAAERRAKAAEERAQAAELAASTAAANCPGNPPAPPLGYPGGRSELLGAYPLAPGELDKRIHGRGWLGRLTGIFPWST